MPAKLLIQLLGEATSAVAAFQKTAKASGEAEGAAKKTGSAWSGVGKVAAAVGGAFAAAKVVEFAKDAISAGSDLNESWSKVGVVFGSSATIVQNWSKTAATSMGLSQQAALEAAGTYGNLAVALGLPPTQAAKMSTSLVTLAGDLASFNNVPVGDALDALKSGLTGEAEPLRRFGVSISAARVEAQALSMGLAKAPVDMAKVGLASKRLEVAQAGLAKAIKAHGQNSTEAKRALAGVESAQQGVSKAMAGGKVNLTDAAKAQATYALIMKDTKTAQGDFIRTSGGLANQQRIAAAQWKDMQATLGTALLPVVTTFAGILNSTLIPALAAVAKFLGQNSTAVQIVAGAILAIVVVTKTWTIVQAILNSTLLANPIFLIVAGIVVLITVIVLVATKTKFFQTVWEAVSRAMVVAWRAATGAIVSAWNATFGFVSGVFRAIQSVAMSVWGWIRANWPLLLGVLTGPFGLAVALVIRYWSPISGFFAGIVGAIAGVFSRVVSVITSPFITAFNIVRGIVDAALGGIRSAVSSVLGFVNSGISAAKNVYNAFARTWNGIQVSMPSVDTHIPGVGKVGGFTLGLPDLPLLAKGAYATAPTAAIFGDRGAEWVLPEGRLQALLAAAARGSGRRDGEMVRIEHAHFSERVDVDVFGKRLAWSLRTSGV
jgi:hypothetical protein